MFYFHYLISELRRRPGRTALTALGLAVGVGLVVIIGALAKGLDDAQDEVLEPLTGVGTDLSVSRPIAVPSEQGAAAGTGGPFGELSEREQRQLQRENKGHTESFDYSDLGQPGEAFSEVSLLASELSFPSSDVARIRELDGAADAAPGLTLKALLVEGEVPPSGAAPIDPHGADAGFEFSAVNVSGIDVRNPGLASVTPDQVTEGRYLSASPPRARGEVVLDLAYARQNDLAVGDNTEVAGERFEVVGLAGAPLGGDASNAYIELGRLQRLSDREGRANRIQVRADSSDGVADLAAEIESALPGADVVTAADLADRIGGSLQDADDLSSKLGTALAIVALLAAFLIATLLTLSSVQKRTRELGTLKALGWRQRLVIRQVSGESLVHGALGGMLGAAIGIAGAALVDAIGLTLEATVERQQAGGLDPFARAAGQSDVAAGSAEVVLGAPVEPGLLLLAVALAIVGGLLAGSAGGLRAARLRPADALRSTE